MHSSSLYFVKIVVIAVEEKKQLDRNTHSIRLLNQHSWTLTS